jgi:uncharacterized protein YjiS (DUF1127 family)
MSDDGFNPDAREIRQLSCCERAALRRRLITRAHHERNRLLIQWIGSAVRPPLALVRRGLNELFIAARTAARRLLARRRQMAELRQLAAMSDLELRDIGITRLEIGAAARSGTLWPRYGLRASPTTSTKQGEKYAQSLLDCPRLGS